jgi:hypothetical protein
LRLPIAVFSMVLVFSVLPSDTPAAPNSLIPEEMIGSLSKNSTAGITPVSLATLESSLAIDPRVIRVMEAFDDDRPDRVHVPRGYALKMANMMKTRFFSELKSAMASLKTRECQPSFRLDFLPSGFSKISTASFSPAEQELIDRFESGFIRIERVNCFEANFPKLPAMAEFLKPEFRQKTADMIRDTRFAGPAICEHVYHFGAGHTEYCYEPKFYRDGTSVFNHSWIVQTTQPPKMDLPTSFREMTFSLVDTPKGTALHTLVYARIGIVPRLFRGLVRSGFEDATSKQMDELELRMGRLVP